MSALGDWLRTQYGPGKPYKSARQLSLAISDGRNPNQVFDIESRGTARPETLQKIAEVLSVPIQTVYRIAGWLPEEEDSDEIDINDPTLRLFFSGKDFDEMNQEEREHIRDAVRLSRRLKEMRKRLEEEPEDE